MRIEDRARFKKLVCVGTPIKHYYDVFDKAQATRLARRHAIEVSKEVIKRWHHYTPIAPALNLLDLYCEKTEREEAFCSALAILMQCKAYAYRKCDLLLSEGMHKELELAKKLGLEIIEL